MEVVSRGRYIVDKIYDRFRRSFTGIYGDRLKNAIPVLFANKISNNSGKSTPCSVCE